MLVPRAHMDSALGGMADEFYLIPHNHTRPATLNNPEMYVKDVLDRLGVPVWAEEDPALFPITDGRCEDSRSFCVVKQFKDCRPENYSWPAEECKLAYSNTAYFNPSLSVRVLRWLSKIHNSLNKADANSLTGLSVSI